MTDLASKIAIALNASSATIILDAARERTIAVVHFTDRVDLYECRAASDDDAFVFVSLDNENLPNVVIEIDD